MQLTSPLALRRTTRPGPSRARGFSLIEVLVTIVIVLFGLLGVIGMQMKASVVEFESYQRGQALSLIRDMEARLSASRGLVTDFLTAGISSTDGSIYVGASSTVAGCAGASAASALKELCDWGELIKGNLAKEGTTAVGAMIGARGCLIRLEPPQAGALADFYVVLVWQGQATGTTPPANAITGQDHCAKDVNFGAGLRRGVSLRVLIPDLKKST